MSADTISSKRLYAILRLEGGAAEDESMSSSGSRERLRRPPSIGPRFAADMLGRSGELLSVRSTESHSFVGGHVNCTLYAKSCAAAGLCRNVPHLYTLNVCIDLRKTEIEINNNVVTECYSLGLGEETLE